MNYSKERMSGRDKKEEERSGTDFSKTVYFVFFHAGGEHTHGRMSMRAERDTQTPAKAATPAGQTKVKPTEFIKTGDNIRRGYLCVGPGSGLYFHWDVRFFVL